MDPEALRQAKQDEEHLKLLSIFYYVSGGLTALVAVFPLLGVAFGLAAVIAGGATAARPAPEAAALALVGGCFAVAGGLFFLLAGALAVLKLYTGHALARHKSRTLCLVVAGLTCLAIPYGTVLGVLTFIVLTRPSVERLFLATADAAS